MTCRRWWNVHVRQVFRVFICPTLTVRRLNPCCRFARIIRISVIRWSDCILPRWTSHTVRNCQSSGSVWKHPNNFVAIGEIGLDLYWDKNLSERTTDVFEKQIEWALEYKLPIVVHSREAFDYIYKVMEPYKHCFDRYFHSFTGNAEEAARLLEFGGFMLGINGVVTFKSPHCRILCWQCLWSGLCSKRIHRIWPRPPIGGKRNESANVRDTFLKLVEIYRTTPEHLSQATSENALKVFGMVK